MIIGEEIQWDEMLDVHVITGVVKLYFRELPMPLITYDIYPSLMQAMRGNDLLTGVYF